MKVMEGYYSGLVYSRRNHRSERDRDRDHRPHHYNADWTCPNPRCAFMNFAKRIECFRCSEKRPRNSSKQDVRRGNVSARENRHPPDDGSSQIGSNPCNTVVLRGLDAFTSEQNILDALATITSLEPTNCYIMRDFKTGASYGYGFMEFDSVANSKKIKDHFNNNQSLEVDGKLVMVDYAKNTYSTIMASIQYEANEQRKPTEYELQALAAKSANQVTEPASSYSNQTTGVNAQPQQHDPNAPPDTSRYVWESSSGYYYDPVTKLYYDANTQYYYNGNTQQFMYWDSESGTYKPATQTCDDKAKVEKEKEEKKKKAKDIAKEMERWAKSQNKRSKNSSNQLPVAVAAATPDYQQQPNQQQQDVNSTADTAYELLVGGKRLAPSNNYPGNREAAMMGAYVATNKMSTPNTQSDGSLVASYGGDESDDDEVMNEANYINRQTLTCNLCERRFNSTAVLEKHVQKSDLHKQNLTKLLQKGQSQFSSGYRDRAKERRMKAGLGQFTHFSN